MSSPSASSSSASTDSTPSTAEDPAHRNHKDPAIPLVHMEPDGTPSPEPEPSSTPAPRLGQGLTKKGKQYRPEYARNLFIYFQLVVCVIGAMLHGYHSGALNQPQVVMTTCPEFDEVVQGQVFPPCFRPSTSLWGTIVGMYSIGGLVGSLAAGSLADYFGRRKLVAINDGFFLAGTLVMSLAVNEAMLIVGRILVGLGGGSSTVVVPMYLNEISPMRIRGTLGTLTQLAFCVGVLFAQIAGLFLSTVPGWRWIIGLSGFFCILQLCLLPFCVESPKWLAMKSQDALSFTSLKRLRGGDDSTLESDFKEMEASFHNSTETYTIKDMVTRRNLRNPMLLSGFLLASLQLCGINAVFFYSTDIFNRTNPTISSYLTVSIGVLSLVATLVSTFLVDKAGRKILLYIGIVGMALTGILFTIAFALNVPEMAVFCSYSYVSFFSISLGPLPFVFLTEVFPTQALGLASSFTLPMNWITGYMIGQVFPLMSTGLGSYAFLPFTGYLVLAFFVVLLFVPETKGKTLQEIYKVMGVNEAPATKTPQP